MPLKVDAPDLPPEQARPAFDRFAWQSFIALSWPADPARRGEPFEPDNPAVFRVGRGGTLHARSGTGAVWRVDLPDRQY